MPNRTIKESICTSDTIDQLSAEEERLFTRLIVNCEDYGRMEARPEIVRAKCFPLKVDQISILDIETWLKKLVEVELIVIYENHGKKYLQFINWEAHQSIRALKSKYPAPDDEGSNILSFENNCIQMNSDVPGQVQTCSATLNERSIDRKDRKDRDPKTTEKVTDQKVQYADYVWLTEGEHKKLTMRYGEPVVKLLIEELDNYKGANPKKRKYESDYRAILSWVVEKVTRKSGVPHNKSDPNDRTKKTLENLVKEGQAI